MALVDEISGAAGPPAAAARDAAGRLGIPAARRSEMLAAARARLAARATIDQDLQRSDAVTHFRSIIRRARRMAAADLPDFEPFLKGESSLAELRAGGLDTTVAKEASEDVTTRVDADGEVTAVNVKRRIRLYSPLEATALEMRARAQLAKIFALYRGAYDPPPATDGGETAGDEVLSRPRDAPAEKLFDAIDKHFGPLKLVDDPDATYIDEIAAAGKEIRRLRKAAATAKKQQPTADKKRPTSKATATATATATAKKPRKTRKTRKLKAKGNIK